MIGWTLNYEKSIKVKLETMMYGTFKNQKQFINSTEKIMKKINEIDIF